MYWSSIGLWADPAEMGAGVNHRNKSSLRLLNGLSGVSYFSYLFAVLSYRVLPTNWSIYTRVWSVSMSDRQRFDRNYPSIGLHSIFVLGSFLLWSKKLSLSNLMHLSVCERAMHITPPLRLASVVKTRDALVQL